MLLCMYVCVCFFKDLVFSKCVTSSRKHIQDVQPWEIFVYICVIFKTDQAFLYRTQDCLLQFSAFIMVLCPRYMGDTITHIYIPLQFLMCSDWWGRLWIQAICYQECPTVWPSELSSVQTVLITLPLTVLFLSSFSAYSVVLFSVFAY